MRGNIVGKSTKGKFIGDERVRWTGIMACDRNMNIWNEGEKM
jgi:hypothetical protein